MASMRPNPTGFDNGIKPTRLWHLTGKKHFKDMMDTAGRTAFQYSRKTSLTIRAITIGCALLTGVMFGITDIVKYFKYLGVEDCPVQNLPPNANTLICPAKGKPCPEDKEDKCK